MKTTRLAITSVPEKDFLVLPHPWSRGATFAKARRAARERARRMAGYCVAAWKQRADIVAGYESVTGAALYVMNPRTRPWVRALAETVPGPTTELFAGLARRYRGHCAVSLEERCGDRLFNTTVLIDRAGRIAGRYRKVHLPPQERGHATPGDGFPVFETDFGRVGFSTCYDLMFPETARCLAMNGADLMIHAGNTAYTLPEETLRVRAAENMFWVMVCDLEGGRSMVVDPTGRVVLQATRYTPRILWVDVDLAKERPMPGDNLLAGVRSLRGRQCQERVPSAYGVLCAEDNPLRRRFAADPLPKGEKAFAKLLRAATPAFRAQAAAWDTQLRKARGQTP